MLWLKFLTGLIFFCILTGGIYIRTASIFIEVSHLSALVILWGLSVCTMFLFAKDKTKRFLEDFWNKLNSVSANSAWFFLVWMLGLIFVAHLFRHFDMGSSGFDLAFINNALFYPFDQPMLRCDVCVNQSYLGEHSSLSLFLVAPLTALFASTVWMTVIQFSIVGFALAFFLKKGPLSEYSHKWLYLLILVFAYKTFRQSMHGDFREDHIAFAAILVGLTFQYLNRPWIMSICFLIAAFAKENVALILFVFGCGEVIKSTVSQRSTQVEVGRIWSWVVLVGSLLVILLNFKVLIPYWTQGASAGNPMVMRFSHLGQTPSEILWNVMTSWSHFKSLLLPLLSWDRLVYVLVMLSPVFILGLKQINLLLPVFAGVLMNCVPEYEEHRSMAFHYDLSYLPFLFFWIAKQMVDVKIKQLALQLTLLTALLGSHRWPGFYIYKHFPSKSHWSEYRWISRIQTKEVIAANMHSLGYLVHLKELRAFPDKQTARISDLDGFSSKSKRPISEATLYLLNRKWSYDQSLEQILIQNGARLEAESNTEPGLALYRFDISVLKPQ